MVVESFVRNLLCYVSLILLNVLCGNLRQRYFAKERNEVGVQDISLCPLFRVFIVRYDILLKPTRGKLPKELSVLGRQCLFANRLTPGHFLPKVCLVCLRTG